MRRLNESPAGKPGRVYPLDRTAAAINGDGTGA
jgi:hypothetical protein